MNNLYGWAMSQKLPIGNFKWLPESEINTFYNKIMNKTIDLESDREYVLEVDIEYPENYMMITTTISSKQNP